MPNDTDLTSSALGALLDSVAQDDQVDRSITTASELLRQAQAELGMQPGSVPNTEGGGFGLRVREARERQGLSLRDLALRSGVSGPMLSQVERGETSPTLNIAEKLAMGLDTQLADLLEETPTPT